MIPQQFLDEQGRIIASLLLSRIGLAFLYAVITAVAISILPRIVRHSVLSTVEMRVGGKLSERRSTTIARLVTYLTRALILVVAALVILHLFVDSTGLFTFLGLFTAAIGFSLRNLVGDYISGVIFLFEDQFAIGEDVEIGGQRGTVIDVTLRTTLMQAESGDIFIVPNGDIRVVHNYTRGDFSLARVEIQVKTEQLEQTLALLERTAPRLHQRIPALLERPQVAVQEGALGASMTVTVSAKTRHGQADAARRRLMEMVEQSLREHSIDLGASGE